MDSVELTKLVAQEALDTKARDLKIMDLRGLVSYTDFFVLATATSTRQSQAIADRVYLKVKNQLYKLPISLEGHASGQWVLLDYGDVVMHIFLEDQRAYYGLDQMWADAPELLLPGQKRRARRGRASPPRKIAAKQKPRRSPPPKSPRRKTPAKKKK